MMKLSKTIAFWLLAIMVSGMVAMNAEAQTKQIAFPGAEGFGRYTTGGRGGEVRHVTNLNDSGAGSLRAALNGSGKKIVVFDVSGTIHLQSALNITSNTTIAGQSAPGDGICIADYPCAIKGNNIIVRYMRFRLGNKYVTVNGADGWDGFGALDCDNIIIDHCSVSWSIDECLSMSGCKNITVQWCLVAQSLVNSGHSKGNHGYGGNWGGAGSTYHHNLMAHHTSRTPRLGPRPTTQMDERMDMRNNVIYNWAGNGCYGGEAMKVNIVNNYYKPGPGTEERNATIQQRIAGIGIRTTEYIETYPAYADAWHIWGKFYVTGNVNSKYSAVSEDNWTYGMYNQIDASGNDGTYTSVTRDTIKIDEPIDYVAVTTHSAEAAYEKVLQYAGASLHRDSFDELMVSDTRDGKATYTGADCNKGCVNSQDDNKPAGAGSDWSAWPELVSTTAPIDTDGDGMPDDWEIAHGLNPNDASDGSQYAAGSAYTNVEVYLNSLVEDITADQNAGGVLMGETLPGESYPVAYTLSHETYQSSTDDAWLFGDGVSIASTDKYKGGSYNFNTFLVERSKQYTITLPDSVSITTVKFSGYCNGTGVQTSKLSELNGVDVTSLPYNFPNRSQNTLATHQIALAEAAKGQLTFTIGGQNATCVVITLEGIREGSGIEIDPNPNPGGGDDELTTIGTGSIYWAFGEATDGQTASYADDIAALLGSNSVTLGSNLTYEKTRTLNDIDFSSIQPENDNEANANDGNAVTFTFNTKDGYYFQPTKVELLASRIGTDGGQIDVLWKNSDGTTEVETSIVPERNNQTPPYTILSKDINYIAAAEGEQSLIIHIYKLGKTKQIALANINITGEVKGAATGIETITTDKRATDGYIYNLQGIRVANPTKGIYIRNGKKFVVK